jgi:DNA-binding NarL/FixJ family response regulator
MIQILIVDDNEFMRKAMTQLIEYEKDLKVCGEADNRSKAIQLIQDLKPDVAIIDISLNADESGLDLIRDIRTDRQVLPILTLSLHDQALYADRAFKAGAQGYLMKQDAANHIVHAIRTVHRGEIFKMN